MSQRLVVPLFQRPYVWNEENQWEPLWDDVVRVAERVLNRPTDKHHPHFLGAVVLQQVQKPTGLMQERTIIDGQQRLTTLQLLLDALHAELLAVDALPPAMRIEPLVVERRALLLEARGPLQGLADEPRPPGVQRGHGAKPPVDYDALGLPRRADGRSAPLLQRAGARVAGR